jgi:nascent polypeptide-associated complex subunit alpha
LNDSYNVDQLFSIVRSLSLSALFHCSISFIISSFPLTELFSLSAVLSGVVTQGAFLEQGSREPRENQYSKNIFNPCAPYCHTGDFIMIPGMGGRGINPKQLQKQMRAMGIDVQDIEDVKQVIIRTATREIVFNDAQVTVMDARGMKSYQVVGTPEERPIQQAAIGTQSPEAPQGPVEIPDADIMLVAQQAKVSRDMAKKALEEAKGDLAEAIMKLAGGQ